MVVGMTKNKKVKKVEIVENSKFKEKEFKLSLIDRVKVNWLNRGKDVILIEMLHLNGSVSNFLIVKNDHKFVYKNKIYIVDEDRKVWSNTTKYYMFRYHEGFALPYTNEVSSQTLKKGVRDHSEYTDSLSQIETSFNPFVLKDVLKFEYAKGVIQGAEVSEMLKRAYFLIIISILLAAAHLAVNAIKSGWI